MNASKLIFVYQGTGYCLDDFIYVSPTHVSTERVEGGRFKSKKNGGLEASSYVNCLRSLFPRNVK